MLWSDKICRTWMNEFRGDVWALISTQSGQQYQFCLINSRKTFFIHSRSFDSFIVTLLLWNVPETASHSSCNFSSIHIYYIYFLTSSLQPFFYYYNQSHSIIFTLPITSLLFPNSIFFLIYVYFYIFFAFFIFHLSPVHVLAYGWITIERHTFFR